MTHPSKLFFAIGCFGVLSFVSQKKMDHHYQSPFPHFDQLIVTQSGFRDAWLIASGFRSLAASLAWVDLLQYTGGGKEAGESDARPYDFLKRYTQRVVRIDPYYYRAYLFGASILAWFRTINRPDEALELLNEGILAAPRYWQFTLYASAIAFKNKGNTLEMIRSLEVAVNQPDCPATVLVVLANTYKEVGRYEDALRLWEYALHSPDFDPYRERGMKEIQFLRHQIAVKN